MLSLLIGSGRMVVNDLNSFGIVTSGAYFEMMGEQHTPYRFPSQAWKGGTLTFGPPFLDLTYCLVVKSATTRVNSPSSNTPGLMHGSDRASFAELNKLASEIAQDINGTVGYLPAKTDF